jgi:multidrug resistance efflux pump
VNTHMPANAARRPAALPSHPADTATTGAAALLAFEAAIRSAATETDVVHLAANELRRLVGARQVFVLRHDGGGGFRVRCMSNLVLGETDTPFVRWIEAISTKLLKEASPPTAGTDTTAASASARPSLVLFDLPAFADPAASETKSYPFGHFAWQPLHLLSGELFAGLLFTRETPWTSSDQALMAREAHAVASAWQALHGARALRPRNLNSTRKRAGIAIALAAVALFPVPLTTLAPVEIIGRDPQRVTAPIDGVIADILIETNKPVRRGDKLLRFDETTLRNRLLVAEQEVALTLARHDRASQSAFADEKARHELAQARAELALKQAERDFAADVLARASVMADRDGILVYPDKERLIGRPVKTGERLMQIVNPADIAARIELPVADAIVLEQGARARLFLDSDPLTSIAAKVVSEGYHAEPNALQQLVYRIQADIEPGLTGLRIGARGTAQLLGQSVPLAFYLLRRPISSLRQGIGL